ncbi:MAG: ATP-binding protein, partial [Pseudomonadota bacterium]|nr:ATP-binding protein [Pseudomonadota bacterium]
MVPWRDCILSFSALPEVGSLLLSTIPGWVWSRDGARLLWANPAGAALLGASRFSALSARQWPSNHPLRRELQGLHHGGPEAGVLARLRIATDARALPIACRCRHVRAGGERGIFAVAVEPVASLQPLPALAAFFSDADARAVIADETGAVVASSEPDAAAPSLSGAPWVELAEAGRKLRLHLLAPQAAPAPEEALPSEPASPPLDDAGLVIPWRDPRLPEAGTEEERSLNQPAETFPPLRRANEDAFDASEAAEPALGADEFEPTAQPTTPAETGVAASIAQPPAPALDEASAPPLSEPPRRSVMAGRVPRELSRRPVRFLWQTDAADRFLFLSPGLAQVVGRNAEIVGERWQDAASRLRLDPSQRIGRALAQRDTWSGQTAWWPVEGSNVRVPAELTALPIFGADHSFQGFRGFGVLKPAEALMPAAFDIRFGAAEQAEAAPAVQQPPYEESLSTTSANVVPIRADLDRTAENARLTPQERNAFEEIAVALRERVEAVEPGMRGFDPAAHPHHDVEPSAAPPEAEASTTEPDGIDARNGVELPRADGQPGEPADAAAARPEPPPASTSAPVAADQPEAAAQEAIEPAADEPPSPAAEAPPETVGRIAPRSDSGAEPAAPLGERVSMPEGEAQRRLREMTAILDTATDGVVIVDAEGVIESVNASAEALFGLDAHEMLRVEFGELLTPETRGAADDYLSGLKENGVASLLNEGREVAARAGSGAIPLFMTMGRISGADGGRFCAVLRDITHWKRNEAELVAARRAAEAASGQKSEFLARVSHEIRTPLNAIIGFAEVMIEERFGPVENERYREYLRDIRASGEHVVSLVNDLLDISKIEAGKLDLDFVAVPLNDLVRECIALMQPQAGRAHVVLRSSLSRDVPGIVADQRTIRQIVLNLLSNSVKFTGPGGQVIASTTLAETGEALLRIRDTGEGMSEDELARAMEPFRQIATATLSDRTGTGLGLPLTKALVEANRASLAIRGARGEGTVVTITFPPTRVL